MTLVIDFPLENFVLLLWVEDIYSMNSMGGTIENIKDSEINSKLYYLLGVFFC